MFGNLKLVQFCIEEFKKLVNFEMATLGRSSGPLGRPDRSPGLRGPTRLAAKRGGPSGGRGHHPGPAGRSQVAVPATEVEEPHPSLPGPPGGVLGAGSGPKILILSCSALRQSIPLVLDVS